MSLEERLGGMREELDAEIEVPADLLPRLAARLARRRRWARWLAPGVGAVAAAAIALYLFTPPAMANRIHYRGIHCPAQQSVLPATAGDARKLRSLMNRIVAERYPDPQHRQYVLTSLTLGPEGSGYGQVAAHFCGRAVANSTWVAQLEFPKYLPSASLSEGQLFITKTRQGWDVWFRYR